MVDDFAKEYLREIRTAVLQKLDGLPEYDIHRPLSSTGTNLLDLAEHLALSESRYVGEVEVNAAFWESRCAEIERAARA